MVGAGVPNLDAGGVQPRDRNGRAFEAFVGIEDEPNARTGSPAGQQRVCDGARTEGFRREEHVAARAA